ncbi:MAG TPA: type II toxin-antitoxin system HicB family antitoxin [Isosphaeraceae bacterium]|nr:type II toxin-antitoxin system HicB family antitoxin [Isosphaeraceae bacterium]
MDKHYTVSDGTLVLFLWPAEEGGYGVTSPLDPALSDQGETIEEAFEMAHDALETLRAYHAERDAGAPVPEKPKRPGSSKRPKAAGRPARSR